jgi:hypothetical protein
MRTFAGSSHFIEKKFDYIGFRKRTESAVLRERVCFLRINEDESLGINLLVDVASIELKSRVKFLNFCPMIVTLLCR